MLNKRINKNKKKIILILHGGLGNQLFSYAAARHLALINNAELVLDNINGFANDKYKRKYQLNHFSIKSRTANYFERLEPFGRIIRYLLKFINQWIKFSNKFYVVQEGLNFDSRLLKLNIKRLLFIEGYWQSENYFKDIELCIRKEFLIKPPNDDLNASIFKSISNKISVAVHIRFFNDIQDKTSDICDENYYLRSIKFINKNVKNAHFFIFSDKPKLVKSFLPLSEDRMTFIGHNKEDSDYADLWLMTKCKHFITANSTFSWWGAWLSENPNKIIIVPKNSISNGEGAWGFDGLIPDEWNRL
jgi:hypothetical protein